MASSLPPNILPSKSSNASSQASSSPSAQPGPSSGGDSHGQRRSGGSGSFGAGASTRAGSAPRNKQPARSQHKQSRRYRLADEDAFAESGFHPSRHQARRTVYGLGSGHHAVDKARYVHANYRFIVDPRRDYHAQSVDADEYLEWSSILQILASPQSQAAACPICLGDPVAPRMAKCGHIFCLHCLIRYMHSTDELDHSHDRRARSKQCPICWDSIYVSETRPVRWYVGQEGPAPRVGEDIVLRLVMRPAGCTLALPKEGSAMIKNEDIPWHYAADVMDFARVMKGTEDYMMTQFDEEIESIEQLERYDELMFGEDSEWTSKAIRAIKELKEKNKGIGNPPRSTSKPVEFKPTREPIQFDTDVTAPAMYAVQHALKSGQSLSSRTTPSESAENSSTDGSSTRPTTIASSPVTSALSTSIAQLRIGRGASQAPSDYYFYQALLHYYLSPLDIRILRTAFGDFSTFPSTILPRVERISTGHIVDDELRKRTKYLAHLPHGCEVCFLECDWTDTVSPEILEIFKEETVRRRKKNVDKDTREEKERIRAEKEEDDKRYAAARRPRPGSPSEKFQPNDFQPLVRSDFATSTEVIDGGLESTSPMWGSRNQNGSSFASLASPSTSPNASRTVWGTTAIAATSPTLQAVHHEFAAPEDGWLQGWERELLAEDEFVAQAEAASLVGESSATGGAFSTSGLGPASGKKKKSKKITLMSTTARRGA